MTDNLQPILAVIAVLALLGGVLLFLRRRGIASFNGIAALRGPVPVPRQLRVMERLPLGPQHALHLVRMGDRTVLVATAPGSCQIIESGFREVNRL